MMTRSADALAFWWMAPGRGELVTERLPDPGPGQVLVRTLASGISRGTERLVGQGLVPRSEWARMRCPNQSGEFSFPLKYGYTSIGMVEQGPEALVGKRVFCLFPHQDRFIVASAAIRPVPDAVPTNRTLLAANMETALNGCWDGALLPGQRIVVLGAGVVGCLFAYLAKATAGTEVTLCDLNEERATVANALGAQFCHPDRAPEDADLVVEASGSARALARAVDLGGTEATILVLSWYGSQVEGLPLGGAFHSRRLRIVSSQVGSLAPTMRPRWDYARRLDKALELLADPALDNLVGHGSRFRDLPKDMPRILADPAVLMHPVLYS